MIAYDTIMTRIKAAGLDVDLQVLYNEASKEYKEIMTNKWKLKMWRRSPNSMISHWMISFYSFNSTVHFMASYGH